MDTHRSPVARRALALLCGLLAAAALVVVTSGLPGAAETGPARLSAPLDAGRLDSQARAYADAYGAPRVAVAAVGPDGEVTFGGVDAAPDELFRIASMSKSFTAAAVMMLVEEGRIDLDTPVVEQLPEFRMADARAERITPRMLMSHTSGLAFSEYNDLALPAPGSLAEAVARLADAGLGRDPAGGEEYHNTNYTLAARMVEVASGTDVDAFLATRVFAPLGMADTTSTFRCEDRVDGLERGHVPVAGFPVPAPELPGACGGSGGVVSTAADMARWLEFQLGDGRVPGDAWVPDGAVPGPATSEPARLLTPESMAQMHAAQPGAGRHGLGWAETELDGQRRVGHTGALFTVSSAMAMLPESGTAVVVLTDAPGAPVTLVDALLSGSDRKFGNPLRWIDVAMAVLVVVSLAGLAAGVARSGRWAAATLPQWRRVSGLVWPALLAVVGALAPLALGISYAGAVTVQSWVFAAWMLPTAAALCAVWVLGGGSLAVARGAGLSRSAPGRTG